MCEIKCDLDMLCGNSSKTMSYSYLLGIYLAGFLSKAHCFLVLGKWGGLSLTSTVSTKMKQDEQNKSACFNGTKQS